MSSSAPPPKRARRKASASLSLDTPPLPLDAVLAEQPPPSSLPVGPEPVPPILPRPIGIFRGDSTIVLPVAMEARLPVPVTARGDSTIVPPDRRDLDAYSAFALPDGALRPFDDAAFTVLDDYCQAHPPASVPRLVLIESEFLRACQPLPEVARNLYNSLVLDRNNESAVVELLMRPAHRRKCL